MKQKGNEWKSRVSKSGKEDEKKKVQGVVINMYLMEWNGKEQELKAKWGSSYLWESCQLWVAVYYAM